MLLVESDELLMLELLSLLDGVGVALVSVLDEVEPEAPMPEELLLGVVLEELALGVVVVVVVVLPEAPIVVDDLSALVPDLSMLVLDEVLGIVEDEAAAPSAFFTLGEGLWLVFGVLESPLDVPDWAAA